MKKFTKKQLKAMVMTAAVIVPMAASGMAGVQEVAAAPKAAVTRNDAAEKVNLRINKLALSKTTPGFDQFDQNDDEGSTQLADWIAKYSAGPLAGVSFELYKLAKTENPGSVKLNSTEEAALLVDATMIEEGITNAAGQLTAEVDNKGSYLIREVGAPESVVEHSDSMVVTLPLYKNMQNGTTQFVNGNVDIYMKNRTNTGSVNVDKMIEDNTGNKEVKFTLTKTHNQKGEALATPVKIGDKTTNGSIDGKDFGWEGLTYGTYELTETDKISEAYQDIKTETFVIDETHQLVNFTGDDKLENFLRPTIEKTVNNAAENVDGLDEGGLAANGVTVGSAFDWHLNTDIPANITEMSEFKVADTMPEQLSFNEAGSEVFISNKKITNGVTAAPTKLVKGTDYEVSSVGQKVTFELTEAGRTKMGAKTDGYLYIKYNTTLNSTTDLEEINSYTFENEAQVDWKVANGPEEGNDKDKSETWTGAKMFQKTDGEAPLKGAEFVVKNAEGKFLNVEDGKNVWVDVKSDAKTFNSDATDAKFVVDGLDAGTYTLIETVTPKDYVTMQDLDFTITKGDAAAQGDATKLPLVEVENLPANRLPLTGGMGYIAAALGGLAAMFVAVRGYRRIK